MKGVRLSGDVIYINHREGSGRDLVGISELQRIGRFV